MKTLTLLFLLLAAAGWGQSTTSPLALTANDRQLLTAFPTTTSPMCLITTPAYHPEHYVFQTFEAYTNETTVSLRGSGTWQLTYRPSRHSRTTRTLRGRGPWEMRVRKAGASK
jgi:hypothetical protein